MDLGDKSKNPKTESGKSNLEKLIEVDHLCEWVRSSDITMVSELLKCGCDPNDDANGYYNPPITTAAMRNDFDMVKLLVEYGARTDAIDEAGKTAMFYARVLNNNEMIKLLESPIQLNKNLLLSSPSVPPLSSSPLSRPKLG